MIKSKELWTPEGFEVSTHYNEINRRKNLLTNTIDIDDTGKCTYTFNELGFRSDSITKEGFKVMSIGCSVTEGIGVNDDETWPAIFCQQIPNSVNLNFGYGGRSNDYIARCLLSYYDLVKPDLVLILYTSFHRREFYTEEGGIEPFHYKFWGYFKEKARYEHESFVQLSNKENDFQNWFKNHMLIKLFLENKKANWAWDSWPLLTDYTDENYYNGSYKPFVDLGVDGIHGGVKTNTKYAIGFHRHINKKYPNLLPRKILY